MSDLNATLDRIGRLKEEMAAAFECVKYEIVGRIEAYRASLPTYGPLHIAMQDERLETGDIQTCLEYAIKDDDEKAAEIARMLLPLSLEQRQAIVDAVLDPE